MKTKAISRFCCLLLATIISFFSAVASENIISEGGRIVIVEIPNNPDTSPRSVVPFQAEFNEVLNYVELTSTSPCGDVSVALTSTACDWYQTVFDTSDGVIIIPVSGESGFYTLTITTSDNTVYVGEFNL